jgi:SPX domain protein involved in polyphosphate accumulation
MKFGEYLRMNLTSEWASQYISYEDMKDILTEVVSKAPATEEINPHLSRQQYFLLADKKVFHVRNDFSN